MGVLDGKVAVITGSTRGLGREMAEVFAREGAAVVVASRGQAAVDRTVAELAEAGYRVAGQPCDVGDFTQVQALAALAVEAFGGFDIWVNNAGLSAPYGPTLDIAPAEFEKVVRTNIMGTYYGSRVAMAHFVAKGSGKLVNLLGRGYDRPVPFQNAYAASKAWLRGFTLALAKEYKNSGVGVFAFSPGMVDTDMLRSPSAIMGYETKMNPLKIVMRLWANPPEVPAQKALWLVSPATDGRTGLQVDVLGRTQILSGVLREGWRRLTGRQLPPVELDITTVPAHRAGE
ncbi:MAG: SDR family oxidoreductase [Anaerolineae bacterium]|nr:SDR family oxidoreductase [Anaerolineae bacterium]